MVNSRHGHAPRRHARRGVALITTVLLCLVAATVALVVLYQTDAATGVALATGDRDAAQRAAEGALGELDAALAVDPSVVLDEVLSMERARVCDTLAVTVQPGAPWPAECGTTWTYTNPASPGPVAVEVALVGTTSTTLTATAAARDGDAVAAVQQRWVPGRGNRASVWSTAALDTAALEVNTTTALAGLYYSPTGINVAGGATPFAVFATDGDVTGTVGDGRVVTDNELRAEVGSTFGRWDIDAAAAMNRSIACGHGGLCFTAGENISDINGTPVEVPADTVAYLVLFNGENLDVHVRNNWAPTGSCASPCDPYATATADALAGTHPAVHGPGSGWTELGTFSASPSALAAFDQRVQVGACGAGTITAAAACAPQQPSVPVTLVVGSPDARADVWFGSPLDAAPDGNVSVITTGVAVVPHWSHPSAGTIDVAADLSIANPSGGESITGWGASGAPASAADPAHASSFSVNGSVVAAPFTLGPTIAWATQVSPRSAEAGRWWNGAGGVRWGPASRVVFDTATAETLAP